MSLALRPLMVRMGNELQMIQGGMELGDYMASLLACGRAETVVFDLRLAVLMLIEKEHHDEIQSRKNEIETILGMMPRKGAFK